jgi:uncharacterized protein (TIGR02996 family)
MGVPQEPPDVSADSTLHNLLRATAREPWDRWYPGTRLVLADYLEERGAPGDDATAALVRGEMPVARWELSLLPGEVPYRLRMSFQPFGEADVFLEERPEGGAFRRIKTLAVGNGKVREYNFADLFLRTYRPPAAALALSCYLWPNETLSVSLWVSRFAADAAMTFENGNRRNVTLTGTDAAHACRRRVLALFPGERVSEPCPRCDGRGECLRRNDYASDSDRNPYFLADCDYCDGRGAVTRPAPDLLPEEEPTP